MPTPPNMPGMTDRLARLEGGFDSFKTVLTIFGSVLALSVTITIAGIVFLSNRIDGLSSRMDRLEVSVSVLPDKVNTNLRELTSTLSQAITAARQVTPQVILLPAPQLPAPDGVPSPQR